MNQTKTFFSIEVENTKNKCAIGETIGNRNITEERIPVVSCEGACVRGEIARVAANLLAKEALPLGPESVTQHIDITDQNDVGFIR